MRENIKYIGLFIMATVVCVLCSCLYNRDGKVTEQAGTVCTITDTTGNMWVVDDERLSEGQYVRLVMYDKGTDCAYTDDEVAWFVPAN